MSTVLQRHVSTHTSHLQARTILFYKLTVLILGSQTLTCLLHNYNTIDNICVKDM
jgi:hypothetical protein